MRVNVASNVIKVSSTKQKAKATKILASLTDGYTVVNMLSLHDVVKTLPKTSKISQYPVVSVLLKEAINDYFNENLNSSLFNTFGPQTQKY